MSLVKNATIIHVPAFLPKEEADKIMQILVSGKFRYQTLYHYNEKEKMIVTGTNHRKSYWLGEHAQSTQNSPNVHIIKDTQERIDLPTDYVFPYTFPPSIQELQKHIEKEYAVTFNSCLVGLFDSPTDKIGFHSDSSESLGTDPQIASVSFGAERRFRIKSKNKDNRETVDLILKHGDLLIMKDGANEKYLHAVPKDPKCTPNNIRINMTFRNYNYDENEKKINATVFEQIAI